MVTQFGMSERVGVMAVGDQEHEIFLGREISQRREVSDQTAQLVDGEVKRLLDEAYAKAHGIIAEHRDLLERITAALLERETIDREDLAQLGRGELLPPLPPAAPPPAPATPAPAAPRSVPAVAAPILGAPPAKPAGA
jgi:cell division protease FtsH